MDVNSEYSAAENSKQDLKDDFFSSKSNSLVENEDILKELLEENRNDSQWQDWVAEDHDLVSSPSVCLFCKTEKPTCADIILHMIQGHNFDFLGFLNRLCDATHTPKDDYSHIRLANYLRTMQTVPESAEALGALEILKQDAFLHPVMDDDSFIYDYDEDEILSFLKRKQNCLPTPVNSPLKN